VGGLKTRLYHASVLLVLVDDGQRSRSVVDVHIFPVSIESILEDVDRCRFNDHLRQFVPLVHEAEDILILLSYNIGV